MSDSTVTPPAEATESAKLHRRALGVPDLVFFIVAASAPLTAVAGGQAATYLVTGNRAVAFMFIPLGIVLALGLVFGSSLGGIVAMFGEVFGDVVIGAINGAIGGAFFGSIAAHELIHKRFP